MKIDNSYRFIARKSRKKLQSSQFITNISSKNVLAFFQFLDLKVVIPSFLCREKNMVFSTPRSEYESYDQTVWGKKGPNKFLQVPDVGLHVWWACGQHALTKCEKMLKKRWFYAKNQRFLRIFSHLVNACWPHAHRTCTGNYR